MAGREGKGRGGRLHATLSGGRGSVDAERRKGNSCFGSTMGSRGELVGWFLLLLSRSFEWGEAGRMAD